MRSTVIARAGALLLLGAFCLLPTTVEAGSVFLKNGYILQGRIVERGDGVVVLGWQNGRVTIHDRFIDEVLLDPAEEELIRHQKELAAAEAEKSALEMENLDLASNQVIALPESYESILSRATAVEPPPLTGVVTAGNPNGGTNPANSNGTPLTGVDPVQNPADLEKIFPALGVSIRVPDGWRVDEGTNAIRIHRGEDRGSGASLTIDLWREGNLSPEVAMQAVGESLAMRFPNAQLDPAQELSIAGKPANSLVCRDSELGIGSRQHVVGTTNGTYLLGMYVPLETKPSVSLDLDEMLESMRFLFD